MNKLLFPLAVAMIVAALVGGFLQVGGPGYARLEKNDNQRMADLRKLQRYYRCAPEVYPAGTPVPDGCATRITKPDVSDPTTGEAYAFALLDEGGFEVCATFQIDPSEQHLRRNQLVFEGPRGCLQYRIDGPQPQFVPLQQFTITPKE